MRPPPLPPANNTVIHAGGAEDGGSPHVIVFGAEFENVGPHKMTVPALSDAASEANIRSVSSNNTCVNFMFAYSILFALHLGAAQLQP